MRIFGFGNENMPMKCAFLNRVSIRNADFWLWEPNDSTPTLPLTKGFYPQCGFLALGTTRSPQPSMNLSKMFLSAMRIFGFGNARSAHYHPTTPNRFYPQCGF